MGKAIFGSKRKSQVYDKKMCQVYDMLKRNFDRVYTGDAGFGGDFQVGLVCSISEADNVSQG